MLQLNCPNCGLRDETDLSCHGEAHIARPANPQQCTDGAWSQYLFMRTNPKGLHLERWYCDGCRCWFNACRDTVTHAVVATYRMGEKPPKTVVSDMRRHGDGSTAHAAPMSSGRNGGKGA